MKSEQAIAKIAVHEDCGNSLKKLLLRDFNIAVAKGDLSFVGQNIADDVIWHLYEPAGQKEIHGSDTVLEEYTHNLVIVPTEIVMDTIITHGDAGAVNGFIKAEDGKPYVFCDIYKFSSHAKDAKIREIISYIIEIKQEKK